PPAGHQPAQGRGALARARPALPGGGLALHADGRQHAGDLRGQKSLRLAERLGETRAASRAHGIFGRVFGRIGDMPKARENLERSVDLARGSDHSETIRALLTLGYHLEVSEADYDAAERAFTEAVKLAERTGDLPSLVELHSALALLSAYRA